MILYLDTSSLVKLYIEEEDSDAVCRLVDVAGAAGTSLIAYAEARSAFARKFREKAVSPADYKRLISAFHRDWEDYIQVNVTHDLVRKAGELTEKHALRGFDAIHLASALVLKQALKNPPVFSCFDEKLQHASKLENLGQPGAK